MCVTDLLSCIRIHKLFRIENHLLPSGCWLPGFVSNWSKTQIYTSCNPKMHKLAIYRSAWMYTRNWNRMNNFNINHSSFAKLVTPFYRNSRLNSNIAKITKRSVSHGINVNQTLFPLITVLILINIPPVLLFIKYTKIAIIDYTRELLPNYSTACNIFSDLSSWFY